MANLKKRRDKHVGLNNPEAVAAYYGRPDIAKHAKDMKRKNRSGPGKGDNARPMFVTSEQFRRNWDQIDWSQ